MNNSLNNLPLEKQLTHYDFCLAIQNINDLNELKHQVCEMHLLYLRQQEVFIRIAKSSVN
ncbi:MAG: hypothetical protein KME09_14385 [Pleurocapsa minor HA4230-MV1]|jgi:hypothetical protein|nr:hypothetical protein [Pleurocapsa minor HA4230-MV1]